jgi:hypothetical protein
MVLVSVGGKGPEMSDDEKLQNFARYQRDFEREERISASRKWWIVALVTGASLAAAYALSN